LKEKNAGKVLFLNALNKLFVFLTVVLFLFPVFSAGTWWDTDWEYRKAITVTDSSGSELTDFQVAVDLTDALYDNTGLVGSWHFSEGSGSRAVDSSGNGNDGTLSEAIWTTGKFGSGLEFSGAGSYVEVLDSGSLDVVDAVSVEAWIELPEPAGPLGSPENPWLSCSHILENGGSTGDGVYSIDPDSAGGNAAFDAYCDMTTDGGGWTLVLNTASGGKGWDSIKAADSQFNACLLSGDYCGDSSTGWQTVDIKGASYMKKTQDGYTSTNIIAVFDSEVSWKNMAVIGSGSSARNLDGGVAGSYFTGTYAISDASRTLTGGYGSDSSSASGCQNCAWDYAFALANGNSCGSTRNSLLNGADGSYAAYTHIYSGNYYPTKIMIFVRDSGLSSLSGEIGKEGAYGLLLGDSFRGRINDQTVSASSSAGWNHVVLTYDRNAPSNQQKLYVNGVLEAQGTLTDAISVNSHSFSVRNLFNNAIDEVKIYSRAISAQEVQEHFDASKARLDLADLQFTASAFVYKLPVTVSGHTENLSDYQVLVKVTDPTVISHIAKSDAGDLRFFETETANPYSETAGKLDYWVEEFEAGTNTLKAWVKTDLAAGTPKTVYMYYGNSSAVSESSGGSVFVDFDDFSTEPAIIRNGGVGLSWSSIKENLHYTTAVNAGDWIGYSFGDSFTASYEISNFATTGSHAYGVDSSVLVTTDTGAVSSGNNWNPATGVYAGTRHNSDGNAPDLWAAVSMDLRDGSSAVPGSADKKRVEVSYDSVSGLLKSEIYDAVTSELEYSVSKVVSAGLVFEGFGFSTDEDGGSNTASGDVDNFRVRKHTLIQPTVLAGVESSFESAEMAIPHWQENDSKVWVKVPSVPASGSTDVFMYYGNPTAESASDGDATFEFFDDFEGTSLDVSKWSGDTGHASVAGSILTYDGGTDSNWYNIQGTSLEVPYIAEYYARMGNSAANNYDSIIGLQKSDGLQYARAYSNPVDVGVGKWQSRFTSGVEATGSFPIPPDYNWYRGKIALTGSDVKYYTDGVLDVTESTQVPTDVVAFIGIRNGNIKSDWFFVRKYASAEPALSVGGEVQSDTPYVTGISFDPVSPEAGQSVTATVTAGDPQGDLTISSYSFTVKSPGGGVFVGPVTQGSNEYSFTPDVTGYWTVEVTVTDAQENTSSVFSEQLTVSGWWNSNWGYRKQITVTDSSGSELTDFQVLVEFDSLSLVSSGSMNSDCGDLRFADELGLSEVGYWLESGCNTSNTKVWVKVPSIPANGSADIFMYYGNEGVSSVSNGEATFDFFDDFEDGNYADKWNSHTADAGTSVSESGGMLQFSLSSGYAHTGGCVVSQDSIPASDYVIQTEVKFTNFYRTALGAYAGVTNDGASFENTYYGSPSKFVSAVLKTNYPSYNQWVALTAKDIGHVSGTSSITVRNIWFKMQTLYRYTTATQFAKGTWEQLESPYATQTVEISGTGGIAPNYITLGIGDCSTAETTYFRYVLVRKYASLEPDVGVGGEEQSDAPTLTGISFNFSFFEFGDTAVATASATDPNSDPITQYDFRVLDGLGNEVLNPSVQSSNSYGFTAENGEPGLWQVKAKASDGEYWSSEFSKEVFVNDSGLATANLSLSDGAYGNTELFEGKVVLSSGQTSGTFTTGVIGPVNFSKWGVVVFSKTTPSDSTLRVDVLDASDDSVLIAGVKNGQNISGLEVPEIKLRANFTSGSTPSLDSWDVSYYSQFKITVTDCSAPYSGEVTAEAIRVSDSEGFGPFTGTGGQVFVEVPPGVYNIQACIPANEKCNWKYNVELA